MVEKRVQELETKVATVEVTVSSILSSIGKLTEVMEENTKAVRDNDSTMQVFISKHESLDQELKAQREEFKETIKDLKADFNERLVLVRHSQDKQKEYINKVSEKCSKNTNNISSIQPTVDQFKKLNGSVVFALLAFVGTLISMVVYFMKSGGA